MSTGLRERERERVKRRRERYSQGKERERERERRWGSKGEEITVAEMGSEKNKEDIFASELSH